MISMIPKLEITDTENLYEFYCWAIWNLDLDSWISLYEPSGRDWGKYAEENIGVGIGNGPSFYEWAADWTDRYQPRPEHIAKFVALSN